MVVQCTASWVDETVYQFSADCGMWWCMGVAQGVGRVWRRQRSSLVQTVVCGVRCVTKVVVLAHPTGHQQAQPT